MPLTSDPFVCFGASHWVALWTTLLLAIAVVCLLRSTAVGERGKRNIRWILAIALVASVIVDPIAIVVRVGWGDSWPPVKQDGLPLYLCDLAALVLAVALVKKSSRLTEIGYLWGLAGTVQGLITPALMLDFPAPEYFGFFLQHSGVPIAALALVLGERLYPQPGTMYRVVGWSQVYLVTTLALNWMLGVNYGFLLRKPLVPTLFDHLGPWPYYLLSLQGVGIVLFLFWLYMAKLAGKLLRDRPAGLKNASNLGEI